MILNRPTMWAIACAKVIRDNEPEWTSTPDVAAALDISSHHVETLCRKMAAAKILASKRGKDGGYRIKSKGLTGEDIFLLFYPDIPESRGLPQELTIICSRVRHATRMEMRKVKLL